MFLLWGSEVLEEGETGSRDALEGLVVPQLVVTGEFYTSHRDSLTVILDGPDDVGKSVDFTEVPLDDLRGLII